jgi:cytoskeleton protein RodZ
VESFGARLKREREQRKITLDDIAVSTKIGARFLAALEEEHFDRLPGGIFNKSFVRAYARHLGIDEDQTVADYVAASAEKLPESPHEETLDLAVMVAQSKKTDGYAGGGIPWGVVALALVIFASLFSVWGFLSREKVTRPGRGLVRVPQADAHISARQSSVPDVSSRPAAPPARASSPPASPSAQAPSAASPAPAEIATATPTGLGSNPSSFLVQIKVREDSWVAIRADGKPIMQDTLAAPAEKAIEARSEVIIKTGNAGALDISFNGKQLPPQGAFSQVKTLTFDSNGLRPETTSAQPAAGTAHP